MRALVKFKENHFSKIIALSLPLSKPIPYCSTLKISIFLLIFIFSQNQSEIAKTERLAKDAEQKRILRSKETKKDYFSRTDKNAARMALKRADADESVRIENLKKDSIRKQIKRSEESKETKELRHVTDAFRHFEMRTVETRDEYQSRLLEQRERQKDLRLNETQDQTKSRKEANALQKVLKRARKADAYEKSFEPNKDWNLNLDKDMFRHKKTRASETTNQMSIRKQKDAEYQREKRSLETMKEKNIRKQKDVEYRYLKRLEEEEMKREKWMDIHRQNNLKYLKQHGSYLRFLLYGTARTSYYGQSLPLFHEDEDIDDWKWLDNKISDEILMASDFLILSQKYLILFYQMGLSKRDVIHLCVGNQNHIFGILGGIWTIGGVLSISDASINEKALQQQVR